MATLKVKHVQTRAVQIQTSRRLAVTGSQLLLGLCMALSPRGSVGFAFESSQKQESDLSEWPSQQQRNVYVGPTAVGTYVQAGASQFAAAATAATRSQRLCPVSGARRLLLSARLALPEAGAVQGGRHF